jgi:uncharacterized membrane protein
MTSRAADDAGCRKSHLAPGDYTGGCVVDQQPSFRDGPAYCVRGSCWHWTPRAGSAYVILLFINTEVSGMQTPLISPNLHVVMIHYPLAMLIAGTLIEFFSFMWPRSSFRTAGRWMILIGALSAIPATFSGIYALKQIAHVPDDTTWAQTRATSAVLSQPEIWNMLRRHTLYQSIATGVSCSLVLIWLGSSDRLRRSLHVILVLLMTVTVAGMVYGAWFGGESIYKKGVAVDTTVAVPTTESTEPTTLPVNWTNTKTRAELMFPPLELHTILAGVAVAFALLSIGLSFRKISASQQIAEDPIITSTAVTGRIAPPTPPSNVDVLRTFNPDLEMILKSFAPAGRFWMLTCLIALLTMLGGLWVVARDADALTQMSQTPRQIPQLLWNLIEPGKTETGKPKDLRHELHAITGAAIVILPIFLAILSRFAPREKIILSITTLVLSAAVAFQIWIGILLLLDTSAGPWKSFNPPETPALVQH